MLTYGTVREPRAYTVTFAWVDFNRQPERQWVCVQSSVGFLLNGRFTDTSTGEEKLTLL